MILPAAVRRLADELAGAAGVEAVVLGGSRASGDADERSDWDLGVYYRDDIDLRVVEPYGEVHPPGSWGRLMNGGAWLDLDGTRVDVLLRDLAVVEHWTAEAAAGRYHVDGLLGYIAGVPTYSLTAEAAAGVAIHGTIGIDTAFPPALTAAAPARWRFHRDFSLTYAAAHAARGNVAGTLGQASRAVFEEAHARACEQRRWVLNEKRLLDGDRLDDAADVLAAATNDLPALVVRLRVRAVGVAVRCRGCGSGRAPCSRSSPLCRPHRPSARRPPTTTPGSSSSGTRRSSCCAPRTRRATPTANRSPRCPSTCCSTTRRSPSASSATATRPSCAPRVRGTCSTWVRASTSTSPAIP